MPSFTAQMIDRTWEWRGGPPLKPHFSPLPEPHHNRLTERYPDDMLEHGPIAVPSNPGAWIVADQQSLHEIRRSDSSETGGTLLERQ
jgi:hypothetical protein